MKAGIPGYLELKENGMLKERVKQALGMLSSCTLCPRACAVNRVEDDTGFCATGRHARVASFSPHFGEEPQLVGVNGSGTIFFSHCNLKCCFCQNYDISCEGEGIDASAGQMASVMLNLQEKGCHNINLVTPSHVVPQILEGLEIAADHGLKLPIVYNTSGYDALDTLRLLDGIVDIYMPDIKFFDARLARDACQAEDYPEIVRQAVIEMHRQVGDLTTDSRGIAVKGLLVRHLVLPEKLAQTAEVVEFLKTQVSPDTWINVMSQYRPLGQASRITELSRSLTPEEFHEALSEARSAGLHLIR